MSGILTITDNNLEDEKINVNYHKIQKMAFMYDALDNGWTIKKLENDNYEFTKNGKVKISKFLKNHLKTKDILK